MSSRPPTPRATGPAEIPIERVYGLDIETDTSVDGLDPEVGAVVAVAVATERGERVFDGPENQLLTELDHFMSSLPAGIVVTWYGSGFDLPYLDRRAEILGRRLGLEITSVDRETGTGSRRHTGVWYGHRHLDAYLVYRNDLPRLLEVSCSLKSVSRLLGYEPLEVDVEKLHRLSPHELRGYVASDARLCRAAALRRWATALPFVDQPTA